MDDAAYMAFLERANAPLGPATPQTTTAMEPLRARDAGAEVPAPIVRVLGEGGGRVYSSEGDEGFEGVSLAMEGGLPDAGMFCLDSAGRRWADGGTEGFARLVGLVGVEEGGEQEGVEVWGVAEWDARGEYADVVEAVQEVVQGGEVRVYRVPRGGTRVEYWVVGVQKGEKGEGRLVGVKALGVES